MTTYEIHKVCVINFYFCSNLFRMNNPLILKFIKFSLVGFSGIFIDFGVTWFLKERIKLQKFVANAIGFLSAATTNYCFNRIWTFESHYPHIVQEYARYMMVVTIGLAINSLVIWWLISKKKQNFYFSKILAIAVTTIWNFAASMLFAFR